MCKSRIRFKSTSIINHKCTVSNVVKGNVNKIRSNYNEKRTILQIKHKPNDNNVVFSKVDEGNTSTILGKHYGVHCKGRVTI